MKITDEAKTMIETVMKDNGASNIRIFFAGFS